MRIRIGYDISFSCSTPTPTILLLSVHPSRLNDLTEPHRITFDPPIPSQTYTDHFGNIGTRIVIPPGILAVSSNNVVCDSGLPDPVVPDAGQIPVESLPDDSLEFLLGSRYWRHRPSFGYRVVSFRSRDARMGTRPGDLRLCA